MPVSDRGRRLQERNATLPDEDAVDSAREYALRLLDQRAYPSTQIYQKLVTRGYQSHICEQVVQRLLEVGILNDRDYAQMLVRTQHTMRGLSRRALSRELTKRGLTGEIADEALSQIDSADESSAALRVALKKARSTQGLDQQKRLRRIVSQLARKGYSSAVAMKSARVAIAQVDDGDSLLSVGALGEPEF